MIKKSVNHWWQVLIISSYIYDLFNFRFGFGAKGLPSNIPEDTILIYTVELLDFAPEEDPSDIPIDKRMAIG